MLLLIPAYPKIINYICSVFGQYYQTIKNRIFYL